MRSSIFSLTLMLLAAFCARAERNVLLPSQILVQNAGNMGMVSAGIGWGYGKCHRWETHLLIGYLPKCDSDKAKITMTIKETFTPWQIEVGNGWSLEPLSCGLYVNKIFGSKFWAKPPERYPDGYYWASTSVRANVFVGQRITKALPAHRRPAIKSITAFYEISTCDLYIRAAVCEHDVRLWDIIGLSLGIKLLI